MIGIAFSLPEEMRELITSDLPIVPAIMTVFPAGVLSRSVGPVILTAGPTVYCQVYQQHSFKLQIFNE